MGPDELDAKTFELFPYFSDQVIHFINSTCSVDLEYGRLSIMYRYSWRPIYGRLFAAEPTPIYFELSSITSSFCSSLLLSLAVLSCALLCLLNLGMMKMTMMMMMMNLRDDRVPRERWEHRTGRYLDVPTMAQVIPLRGTQYPKATNAEIYFKTKFSIGLPRHHWNLAVRRLNAIAIHANGGYAAQRRGRKGQRRNNGQSLSTSAQNAKKREYGKHRRELLATKLNSRTRLRKHENSNDTDNDNGNDDDGEHATNGTSCSSLQPSSPSTLASTSTRKRKEASTPAGNGKEKKANRSDSHDDGNHNDAQSSDSSQTNNDDDVRDVAKKRRNTKRAKTRSPSNSFFKPPVTSVKLPKVVSPIPPTPSSSSSTSTSTTTPAPKSTLSARVLASRAAIQAILDMDA
jgi:hypothetical protein